MDMMPFSLCARSMQNDLPPESGSGLLAENLLPRGDQQFEELLRRLSGDGNIRRLIQ
nr:hypothetical protein [Acetobacter nitrogenifigens]